MLQIPASYASEEWGSRKNGLDRKEKVSYVLYNILYVVLMVDNYI